MLADAVLVHFGFLRTAWREDTVSGEWSHAEFQIPGKCTRRRIAISGGGVVSIEGQPFTPDLQRPNECFDAVAETMADLVVRVSMVSSMRVLMGHSKSDSIFDTECRWYAAPDFQEASTLCREFIVRHRLKYGEFKGGELRTTDGQIPGIVAYNGDVWSTNGTKRIWSPHDVDMPRQPVPAMGM